jgi:molecular chaperone GrpE
MKKDHSEKASTQDETQEKMEEKIVDSTQEESEVETHEESKEELSETEVWEQKWNELNNKYLRLYSDFENFRKRTAREKLELIEAANQGLLQKLLPVMDDFERAINSNAGTEDINALKEGFDLIYNKLSGVLSNEGVKSMDSIGTPFDVEYHEAITNIPAPKKSQKGKVLDVTEKGYFYKDKVLRYAKVVVGA